MNSQTGCLVAIAAVLFLFYVVSKAPKQGGEFHGSDTALESTSPEQSALSQIKLDSTWSISDYSIMEANFTIENNSDHDMKDFEITCNHFAKSGTHIDSNTRTIYDIVKAHKKKHFQNFNMGFINSQADKSACTVTSAKVASK